MQAKPAKILQSDEVRFRSLRKPDLQAVAQIHVAALPQDPMTVLGSETVRRFYEWQLIGPHSASAVGAFIKDKCVGFFFGGVFRGSTSGFLKENRWYLAWRVLTHPWLVRKQLFREHVISKLWNPSRLEKHEEVRSSAQHSFSILALSVSPEFQRLGLGRLLMQRAEEVARKYSFDGMQLTITSDNDNALGFCQRLGWQKISEKGQWRGQMRKSFS